MNAAQNTLAELARLGSATVYEAGGRRGYVDADLHQILPGSRVAGPARTVLCGQDDNLMVHAVMAAVRPGEVIVLTMPSPRPVALVGDLLATQALAQGAAGMLIDASVRDVEELAELGLPIWARWIRVKGAAKDVAGTIGEPVVVGGATIRTADVLVLDADGVAVVEHDASTRCSAPHCSARSESASSAPSSRAARSPRSGRTARTSGDERDVNGPANNELTRDVAHIHHAELLTPTPQESLDSSPSCSGCRSSRDPASRCSWRMGKTQAYGLELTESALPGLGHMALRAWSPEGLDRRVEAIEAAGLGDGWLDGDHGHGPAYQFRDPDEHRMEIFYEADRYQPPEQLRPRLKNVPSATSIAGRRSSASTTSTSSRPTSPPTARSRCSSWAAGSTSR